MKKNKIVKLGACALLSVTLLSTTAFAEIPNAKVPILISAPIKEDLSQNKLISGTVSDVKTKDNSYIITIENDDMEMVFTVKPDIFVIDQKTNQHLNLDAIKVGNKLTAIINKNAPMTLSLPPMTNSAIGFILNSDSAFLDLSFYNDQLINKENTLALNIDKDTNIVAENGAKMRFSANNIKQRECLVFYTISTKSIPAQTTPQFVMIMNKKEEINVSDSFVPLRTIAEEKGYNISWTANNQPILLNKDNTTISINIGQTDVTYSIKIENKTNLKAQKITQAPKLEKGLTYVPQSFLDSL